MTGPDAAPPAARAPAPEPRHYIGRFAPSPTGPLHAGSLVAALGSWLDARAHGGQWLVRIEDVDTPRCQPGADTTLLRQLADCGLVSDLPPLWQSRRGSAYAEAIARLQRQGQVYPCGCSRREVADALTARGAAHRRFGDRIYPGTCRPANGGLQGRQARATRLLTVCDGHDVVVDWQDRRLGALRQNLAREVGDFVLQRADGLWAYQLAVVVDDGAQAMTDIVRGEDLADNTARQIHLQRLLGLRQPRYLHLPLVMGADGHKLSKQNGAPALRTDTAAAALAALRQAAAVLELPPLHASSVADWLAAASQAWAARWVA